jgi:hypothetical protein
MVLTIADDRSVIANAMATTSPIIFKDLFIESIFSL